MDFDVDRSEKNTIGLLLADATERTRCAEHVEALNYEPLAPNPAEARVAEWDKVDLVIADVGAARPLTKDLLALKKREADDFRFLPLVTTLPMRADFAWWLATGFDDLIRLPTSKDALAVRMWWMSTAGSVWRSSWDMRLIGGRD